MERSIELFACLQFLVIGLSHLLQPHVWVALFVALRGLGLAGVFANSFLSLLFGSVIVAFHDVWTGLPVILTLLGWAQLIKAAVGFTAPRIAMRSLQRVAAERAWEFQLAGVAFLGIGGVLAYVLARG